MNIHPVNKRILIALCATVTVFGIAFCVRHYIQVRQEMETLDVEEIRNIVEEYYGDGGDYHVLDYAHNENESGEEISLAVIFSKDNDSYESNILIVTDAGCGVITLGAGVYPFKYLGDKDRLKLYDGGILTVSFQDEKNGKIYDYEIQYIEQSEKTVLFRIVSETVR